MQQPTWKNTLHHAGLERHSIDTFAATAIALGYAYILWNDRVYSAVFDRPNVEITDTGLTIDDLPVVKTRESIVIACYGHSCKPTLQVFEVNVTSEEQDSGEHYEIAKKMARDEGYAAPFVCFDKSEHDEITMTAKELDNQN